MMERFLAVVVLLGAGPAAQAQGSDETVLQIYPGNLTFVEETVPVSLPSGRTTLRLDIVRGNVEASSLEVIPLDHPGVVHVVAMVRRQDLGDATLVEVEAERAVDERLQVRFRLRGLSASVHYVAAFDAVRRTLDLAQEIEIQNGAGEEFEQVDVQTVFGDVKRISPTALLHGRAPEPAADAPAGLPAGELLQDFAEHTAVSFGRGVRLAEGETVRRRTLEKRSLPASIEYRFDATQAGGKVTRTIEVPNGSGEGMGGVTLPAGSLFLVEREAGGTERFVRRGSVPHRAPGSKLELDVGPADDLIVERERTDLVRSDLVQGEYNRALVSYSEEEAFRLEIRNHAAEARTLVVTEHISGSDDFEVMSSSVPAEKKNRTTIELRIQVPASGSAELTYRVKKKNVQPS